MHSYSSIIEYISYVEYYNPVIFLFLKILYIYFLSPIPFYLFYNLELYLLSFLTYFTCFLHPLQFILFM